MKYFLQQHPRRSPYKTFDLIFWCLYLSNTFSACIFLFFRVHFFFFFWLHWVFVAVRVLSLVVASGGYSIVVRGLLIVVASLVAEHKL